MTRPFLVTVLVLAAVVSVPIATIGAQQSQGIVFHAATDLVSVDVNVQRGKTPVTGLQSGDFEVLDNGVLQTVTELSYGRMPIDLRLVFDTSGSIDDGELGTYVRAMREIAQHLQPDDRCDIVTFSARIVEAAALQPPPVKIDARRVGPDMTSFFDAVSLALVTPPVYGRRQLTIVMSDADDNASFFDEAKMTAIAGRTDAVVYAILPISEWPADDQRVKLAERRLGALTKLTGGRIVRPNHDLEVAPAFLTALEEFRKSYVVVYTATGVAREGWHTLSISVRGSKPYTVRARSGYGGAELFSTETAR